MTEFSALTTYMYIYIIREEEREILTDRKKERKKERKTDRQTDRQTDRHALFYPNLVARQLMDHVMKRGQGL